MGKLYKEQDLVNLNVQDVEEGEHSDSGSLEEISENIFNAMKKRQTLKRSINGRVKDRNNRRRSNRGGRVWTTRDVYKGSGNSYLELHHLTLTQSVNKQQLDEAFVMTNGTSNDNYIAFKCSTENIIVVEDDYELEEGEINMDVDMDNDTVIDMDIDSDVERDKDEVRRDSSVKHMKKQVDMIKEELESLNVDDGDVSCDSLCSRLEKATDTLHVMIVKDGIPEKEALVQLVFTKIIKLLSSHRLNEQNKDVLTRLTAHANREPPLFSYGQLKEIKIAMFSSWNKPANSSIDSIENTKKQIIVEHANDKPTENPTKREMEHVLTTALSNQPEDIFPEENEKSGPSSQTLVLPLLELHNHRDADNFPSPPREISVPLPCGKGFSPDCAVSEPERPVPLEGRGENILMFPCKTDAVRAVSSDQQELIRSEFLTRERLPSPTSTKEGDIADGGVDGEVADEELSDSPAVRCPIEVGDNAEGRVGEEVSSSLCQDTVALNNSIPEQSLVSSDSDKDLLTTEEETRSHGPPTPKAKRRNPRLRLAKSGVAERDINVNVSSRVSELSPESHGGVKSMQQAKMADEDLSDSPSMKRRRYKSTSDGDACYLRTGGSSGDSGTVALDPKNMESEVGCVSTGINTPDAIALDPKIAEPVASQSMKRPVKEFHAALSLSSLVRDIVVNPSTWIDILKVEHAKSSKSIKCTSEVINSSSTGALFSSVNGVLPTSSFGQITTKETLKEDSVKVRMKPRDPRRKLYDGALLKGANTGSDQSEAAKPFSRTATLVNLNATKEDDQSNKLGPSSSPKLKNSSETASAEAVTAPLRSKNANAWSDFHQLLGAFDDEQKALIQIERAKRLEEQRKMFAHRKLSLVLDLDHTLLNSAMFVEVNPQQNEILRKKEVLDRQNPPRHLFRSPNMRMWTKLRPGIWNFLEKASKLYELHVYTMGNRSYAAEMAKLLDPNGELFAGRVLSRGDDCGPFDGDDRFYKTKDLEGVLGLETNVVIIDDTIGVWPHNRPNLIVVERYMYFPCSRRQFGLQGPSLLEIDYDERPEDGTLASCLAVIERIHGNFFAHNSLEEADVRDILASEQRKILSGCRIIFSRVFRVGEANPHMHPLWKTAEQFGAVCTECVDERVTHVVAISLGTDKVNWALSRGRFVVHPGWVEASALLYRRANEYDFALK